MAEFTGRFLGINIDFKTQQKQAVFSINERSALESISSLDGVEKLVIKAVKHREKRSLDANGLLWKCLGDIAHSMNPPCDKWEVYLQMLKRYGVYTLIYAVPNAVESVKLQWRECEVVGETEVDGQKYVQMLCYFGSSTYNTKEFSVLLDGVISEMKEMGLETPTSEEMRVALERLEKQNEKTA